MRDLISAPIEIAFISTFDFWPKGHHFMTDKTLARETTDAQPPTRREELRTFLFLSVILAPVLAVVLVGGYGFVVWMSQLILGPPGS